LPLSCGQTTGEGAIFRDWRADIERRASEIKETLTPERGQIELQDAMEQLLDVMEHTEKLVDWFDTAGQHEAAYSIVDGMIASCRKHMTELDPASPSFDVTTTTYPPRLVNLLLEWDRITIERLNEMRQEINGRTGKTA
jgi:hypothetical protein